jgi:cytochrome d ubiquinol oxidase subunit II
MFDLETLRVIWWVLLGVLLTGFALTDGWDLGIGTLLPLVARNERERDIVVEVIAPVWEGNQVWIILGAGSIFAAWPYVYAVAFSGAYFVILLLLLAMGISRPVSIKYRTKVDSLSWQRFWSWTLFTGSTLTAIIFGMLVGNTLIGLPFNFDTDLRITYTGHMFDLFNPFALWSGLTSLAMLIMHGALYLAIKTEGIIRARAILWARIGAFFLIVTFAIGGFWIAYRLTGYQVVGHVDPSGFSNPMHKEVIAKVGAWMTNYSLYPITMAMPALGLIGALFAFIAANFNRFAFFCSCLSIIGVIGTVGVSMFPFILPSSTHYSSSLLVWDASSTQLTLLIMFFATIFLLPIVIIYTMWVYRALGWKVTKR